MRLTVRRFADDAELARRTVDWAALLERSADNQPTQSPLWQTTWWRVFGGQQGRQLVALGVFDGDNLVGLAPLCRRTHSYALGLSFKRLELCASGEDERDEICSDYIGVAAERGREVEVAEALATALLDGVAGEWDELVMPAMNAETLLPWAMAEALERRGVPTRVELSALSPYIPLPESFDAYLERLSPSRRYNLRRSMRDFERWADGRAEFEVAQSAADVERGFAILKELHAERWQADHKSGAFASRAFSEFHRAIVPELFARGALDLAWVSVDGRPLAAVYNVVHDGHVYFYQSGRRADLPPKARAGLVLHAHAIRRAIEAGHREYDFLPGPSQYKLSLALATRPLVALRAARPTLRETARVFGEHVTRQARVLRAAVAPKPQLLQEARRENGAKRPEFGLATDLALAVIRRLRSSHEATAIHSSTDGETHAS